MDEIKRKYNELTSLFDKILENLWPSFKKNKTFSTY